MRRSDELRFGLVGLGAMGRRHLEALLLRHDVRLVAIADPVGEAVTAAASAVAAAGAEPPVTFSGGAQLIEAGHVDAVVIASPASTHAVLSCAAAEAGLAVLVEKPIAATVDEARAVVRCVERNSRLLQVGHSERFNPAFEALANELREGHLGEISRVETVRVGPPPDRATDVGVTLDLAIHDIDLICHLLADGPRTVQAEIGHELGLAVDDLVRGRMTFSSGATASVDASWLAPLRSRHITVFGERGTLVADLLTRELWFTAVDGAGRTVLTVGSGDALRGEHDAFIKAIRTGSHSVVPASDGLLALQVAQLMIESAAAGRPFPSEEVVTE